MNYGRSILLELVNWHAQQNHHPCHPYRKYAIFRCFNCFEEVESIPRGDEKAARNHHEPRKPEDDVGIRHSQCRGD